MQLCTGTGAFGSGRHGSGGPRGDIRAMPPKGQSPGTSIYHNFLPSKPKPGLLDPLGPLAEVDFLSGFRALRDCSGPQEESGLYRTNPGPAGWTRKTNQGSARQIRARRTNQGPARQIRTRKTNQGPAGQIRDHGTDQNLAIRIGPRRTDQGPERRIRAPQDGSGPRGISRAPRDG